VQLWKTNRKLSRSWGLLFTLLACCVFLWGFQYKLSLYDPPQAASHHVPMAKLLSKNEQSGMRETSAYTQSKPTIKALVAPVYLLPLALFVLCALGKTKARFRVAVTRPPLQLRQALQEAFFVLPPPAIIA
jgi:hypothetical protein